MSIHRILQEYFLYMDILYSRTGDLLLALKAGTFLLFSTPLITPTTAWGGNKGTSSNQNSWPFITISKVSAGGEHWCTMMLSLWIKISDTLQLSQYHVAWEVNSRWVEIYCPTGALYSPSVVQCCSDQRRDHFYRWACTVERPTLNDSPDVMLHHYLWHAWTGIIYSAYICT